jgi:hypothetical protein
MPVMEVRSMSAGRLVAIVFIFCCTAVAWFVLGGTIMQRSGESDQQLEKEVERLWGGRHLQRSPNVAVRRGRQVQEDVVEKDPSGALIARQVTRNVVDDTAVTLLSSRATVALSLDQRRKGLLWYDTYGVVFEGRYRFRNPDAESRTMVVHFPLPSDQGLYDAFTFKVNGQETPPVTDLSQGATAAVVMGPNAEGEVVVGYRSRGLGDWTYAFGPEGVAQVRDFTLDMTTDFARIDFPAGTLSPSTRERQGAGWHLRWSFESLVTGQRIGMDTPNRLNPGPFAARVTFFAPVSLLFFITVLVMLGVLRGNSLHPMNYFFLSGAFFAFHLLLAYLVDHLDVNASFAIAATVSVVLVVSYLRLVAGMRYAVLEAGLAQVVFLVLFSYAFFFEGYTGLTVTVGAVLTLFVLMQMTGRVKWEEVFTRRVARAS